MLRRIKLGHSLELPSGELDDVRDNRAVTRIGVDDKNSRQTRTLPKSRLSFALPDGTPPLPARGRRLDYCDSGPKWLVVAEHKRVATPRSVDQIARDVQLLQQLAHTPDVVPDLFWK